MNKPGFSQLAIYGFLILFCVASAILKQDWYNMYRIGFLVLAVTASAMIAHELGKPTEK